MQEIIQTIIAFTTTIPSLVWASCLLLCIAAWMNMRSQRRVRHLQKELEQTRSDIRALTTSSVGVGGRIKKLEQHQRRLAEKQEEFNLLDHYSDQGSQPYDHAIHMARQGADVDEIVNMCGVSRNEAELIQMMNRFEKAS